MPRYLNLPNLLSFSRLIVTPVAVFALLGGSYRLALGVFAAAAVTDGLDGFLARKWRLETKAGAYLDPIADKVFLVAVYLALGLADLVPRWLVGIILGRDALLLALAGLALLFTNHREFPPSVWGKLSTFVQILTAAVVIGSRAIPSLGLEPLARTLIWAAAAATTWSGIHYGWRGFRLARSG